MPTDARSSPLRFREEVRSRGNLGIADEVFAAHDRNLDPVDSWNPQGPDAVR